MGREPEEWDVRAGKGLVGGDDDTGTGVLKDE